MAEALYRKYRPQIFEDVVGQENIERTIRNALDQDKVSHAYLFTGPRGTGKTTIARLLAKALICEKGLTSVPDGTCSQCEAVANGTHPDVYELDAASRTGVENVREEIIGRVQFSPTLGRYKVYIIDEIHMLSGAAFNALLKTLEEPPLHVVFILCTTDPQKVPETIHSRCQRFDFHRISVESIVSRLGAICVAEDVEFEGEALELIANRAEGGMRNALTSLEQLIAFSEGKVTLENAERLLGSLDSNDMAEIVTAIGTRDVARCFTWTAEYIETGSDLAQFVRDLTEHVRNLYILALSDEDTVFETNEITRRELSQELHYFGPDRLARMLGVLGELSIDLRTSINPRLSFEIALTRMVRPDSDVTLEALAERVEALEAGYSAVSSRSATSAVEAESAVSVSNAAPGVPVADAASVAPVQPPVAEPVSVAAPKSAETPAPAQAPAVCQGGASLEGLSNPAALQRIWQTALQQIKKEKAAYGVLFINTKVAFDAQQQEITIEFLAENEFAYAAVQKPEALNVVAQALEKAAGAPIAFRYVKAEEAAAPAVPQQKEQAMPPVEPAEPQPAPAVNSATGDAAENNPAADTAEASTNAYDVPESESIPLEAYDSYAPSKGAVAEQGNDFDKQDIQSLLTEGFGDGVIFEAVDDE